VHPKSQRVQLGTQENAVYRTVFGLQYKVSKNPRGWSYLFFLLATIGWEISNRKNHSWIEMSDLTDIRKLYWGSIHDNHLSQTQPRGKCGSTQQKNHRSPHPRSPAGSQLLVVVQTAPLMMTPPPCPPSREEGPSHLGPPLPAPGSYPSRGRSPLRLAFTATSWTNTGVKKQNWELITVQAGSTAKHLPYGTREFELKAKALKS
jgi:hypothetical protein